MSNRRRPVLLIAACALALSATAGYAWIDRWQRTAIFSVELGESRWWREPPPATIVFDIALPEQQKIRAWYLPQDRPDAPTVLYLHGSRWNLNDSVARIERWADMGFSVLAIELAQVLARFRNPPPIVFVTAHEQHAVDAFELRAVDERDAYATHVLPHSRTVFERVAAQAVTEGLVEAAAVQGIAAAAALLAAHFPRGDAADENELPDLPHLS